MSPNNIRFGTTHHNSYCADSGWNSLMNWSFYNMWKTNKQNHGWKPFVAGIAFGLESIREDSNSGKRVFNPSFCDHVYVQRIMKGLSIYLA